MPDIISPSTITTNGLAVTATAPMPCKVVAAPVLATTEIISPRNWCANGDIASDSNPIPITLV